MIRAVIIDDEIHCISRLERLLGQHCREEVAILGTANTVADGYELIDRLKPDLVFLDIQLHDQTGFDLLQQFEEIDFEVIFCTAYEQYTLQAIKFGALDYLLKPIDVDDLTSIIMRFQAKREKHKTARMKEAYEMTMLNISHNTQNTKRIAIPTLTGFTLLDVKDITYCESDVNYTKVHMLDNKIHVVARTLKDFESMLVPYDFVRLHNSYLVNVRYIKHYNKGKGGFVVLSDKTELEVSVRRKEALMQVLGGMKL